MSERTREELLEELKSSQRQVIALLKSMADVQDWQPEPAEWSFRYIAAHLATVEQKCHLHRVKRIASGEEPHLTQYTNTASSFGDYDLHDSLQRWVSTREKLIAFVESLSRRELSFTGIHETVGKMTLLEALEEILVQDRGNLRHVSRLILDYHEEQFEKQVARSGHLSTWQTQDRHMHNRPHNGQAQDDQMHMYLDSNHKEAR